MRGERRTLVKQERIQDMTLFLDLVLTLQKFLDHCLSPPLIPPVNMGIIEESKQGQKARIWLRNTEHMGGHSLPWLYCVRGLWQQLVTLCV